MAGSRAVGVVLSDLGCLAWPVRHGSQGLRCLVVGRRLKCNGLDGRMNGVRKQAGVDTSLCPSPQGVAEVLVLQARRASLWGREAWADGGEVLLDDASV